MREELRKALMLIKEECKKHVCESCDHCNISFQYCPYRGNAEEAPFSWEIPEPEAEASKDPCKGCKYEDASSYIEPCLSCDRRHKSSLPDNFESKERKHYIPFDLSKKEVRDKLRGKWIVHKKRKSEIMIYDFWVSDGTDTWFCMGVKGKDLLESFTFLDGSPCGEEVEDGSKTS